MMQVWHRSWRGDQFGTCVAEFTDARGVAYCWVIPPGSNRPLTFTRSDLTPIAEPNPVASLTP